jgi:NAD+ synthase (glutamine-hydrolysing)
VNRIRLGAAALNQTPLDWDTNCDHIRAALDAAREAGVGILCLPELCITGYGCEDMFFAAGVQRRALELLCELVPDTHGIVACLGLPVYHDGGVYNAAAVACDGKLLGLVAKQHLAGDGIHYEPRWFRRWPAGVVSDIDVGEKSFPIGDLLFDCGGVRIGLEICRDAWVADRTGARLAQRGADVLLNPSASHFAFAKQLVRERFVLEGSRAFCVSYAYCNLLGNEAGRSIYDGGTLIASGGKMLVRGPRFSFAHWLLTTAVIDVDGTRRMRAENFLDVSPRPAESDDSLVAANFEYSTVDEPIGTVAIESRIETKKTRAAVPGHPAWETGEHQKQEEFARSVALALFDYLRKSYAKGFVVSISGGVDSSAVTVLVNLAVQFGARELGLKELISRLTTVSVLDDLFRRAESSGDEAIYQAAIREVVHALLTCVYQSTRNSSIETLSAARAVASAVGARFREWSVDAIVDQYVDMVSTAIDQKLSWEHHDVALQNIQARARGPGAWLLANVRGALLLTTSNRSEAAAGYATMDGDTCGGLAPIAGIDKAFLLDWLKWMETTGPAGVGPLPALSVVNKLPPTAELRPPAASQTDEADLMPYRVLDAIERAAIRDKMLPVEVFQAVQPLFPQHEPKQLGEWVERFFRLWCRNQWKRERYAPSFHLDDENLDPKTWCRFPILNSGFERELQELREYARSL